MNVRIYQNMPPLNNIELSSQSINNLQQESGYLFISLLIYKENHIEMNEHAWLNSYTKENDERKPIVFR